MLINLTADQIAADNLIKDWFLHSGKQIFVLAGYAGTGKTTLLKHTVTQTLGLEPDESAAFVTPTGKAATVLIRSGLRASTLHKLIYQSIAEETETERSADTKKRGGKSGAKKSVKTYSSEKQEADEDKSQKEDE